LNLQSSDYKADVLTSRPTSFDKTSMILSLSLSHCQCDILWHDFKRLPMFMQNRVHVSLNSIPHVNTSISRSSNHVCTIRTIYILNTRIYEIIHTRIKSFRRIGATAIHLDTTKLNDQIKVYGYDIDLRTLMSHLTFLNSSLNS